MCLFLRLGTKKIIRTIRLSKQKCFVLRMYFQAKVLNLKIYDREPKNLVGLFALKKIMIIPDILSTMPTQSK